MVIWLRAAHASVALVNDVVRAPEWLQLEQGDQLVQQAEQMAAAQREQARREADALLRHAHWQAACVLERAESDYHNSMRRGYEVGLKRALRQEHAARLRHVLAEQAALESVQPRIAQIIQQTVERMVGEVSREAVFAHVAHSVERHLEEMSWLGVTVAPEDLAQAATAFAQVSAAQRWRLRPRVQADAALSPGTCVCEWDHGVLEASLETQLSALAQALDGGAGVGAAALDVSALDVNFSAHANANANTGANTGANTSANTSANTNTPARPVRPGEAR
ncbi:type III secretion system stator protein SctL [Paraburkholderia bonniea]|uniref:type III secretion system stator protein SctL n=1 Tax=Paraburkholderia bonniea TaxID=2152891 RepID=UPI001291DFC8|nr:type III secretion system stator protein SctL [Paraburkholderia bonniea]